MACLYLAKLLNRKILRISGPDCYSYLQGLLCNDLTYLYEPDKIPKRKHARQSSSVMSSFMLNAQGRAICDMLIYRTPSTRYECKFLPPGQETENDELLIECDSSLASGLANTLYGYRVRRKITISLEDNKSIWSLFPNISDDPDGKQISDTQELIPFNSLDVKETISENLTIVHDPRLTNMGLRIISTDANASSIIKYIQSLINVSVCIKEATMRIYDLHRYHLGLGEGVLDHPESNCFPLECNADYLGSVSFTKGCYLGQELTARIHFTGVVRKRLMPLLLETKNDINSKGENFLPTIDGSLIVEEGSKKKIGVLRHVIKNSALALLRSDLIDEVKGLVHEGSKLKVSTFKPYWWSSS